MGGKGEVDVLARVEGLAVGERWGEGDGDGEEVVAELGEFCVGGFLDGGVALDDEDEVDSCGFNDVGSQMGDVEVEDGEDEDGGGDVDEEEEEIILWADPGESGGAEGQEGGDGEETEDDVGVADAFGEEGFLDEEVEVEGGVEGEEDEDDAAQGAVVGVEFFVGETGEVGDWGPGRFESEHVVKRKLGGGDDAEAFGEVEVVYRMSILDWNRI